MTVKGLFFDLDGTLVDTHRANFKAYQAALKDHGVELTEAEFMKTIGKQAMDFLPQLAPDLTPDNYRDIAARKAKYYKEFLHLTERNERLIKFLESLAGHHITALITTAKVVNAMAILEHHKLAQYFDFIVTAEDVSKSKPNPEPYLVGLKRARLQPQEVVAFEDSEPGRAAAEAAGITVITIKEFNP